MRMVRLILVVSVSLLFSGCTYYNTFYNAQKAFEEGERIRLNQILPDGTVPPMALASYELAIENAGLVLRDHPGSSLVDDALILIGDARAIQGQYLQAIKRYEQVLRLFPNSEFAGHCLFSLGKNYLSSNDTTRADELLERFILEYPESKHSPDAYILRGKIAFGQNDYENAIIRFEKYLNKYPDNDRHAEVLYHIAKSHLELNHFAKARNFFAQGVKKSRTKALKYKAGFMLGESLRREKDYAKALEEFETLLEQREFKIYHAEVMLAMATCLVKLHRNEEAISRYETITSIFANDRNYDEEVSQALFELGELYKNTGSLELAQKKFADALRRSPRSFWVRNESERKNRAVRELQRLNTNLENRLSALASRKSREETGPEALSDITRLLENVVGLRFQMAENYLFELEMPDSALSQYLYIENESVDSSLAAKAAFARAWILYDVVKNTNQSKSAYLSIIEQYPETDHAVEAAILLSRPIERELSQERMLVEAERLLFEVDQPDSAYNLYTNLANRYPKGEYAPRALFALGWLAETHYGDPEAALEHYRKIVEQYPRSDQAKSVRDKIKLMEELLSGTEFNK